MKIHRKKFFLTFISAGFLGFRFIKNLPSRALGKISNSGNDKINVKINPTAVSRKRKEDNHA